MSSRLEWLGSLPLEDAEAQLLTCCASRRWARKMVANRPYMDEASLDEAARAGIRELDWADIEEALSAHPRIGDRAEAAKPQELSQREAQWSQEEQSGTASAEAAVLEELRARNIAYENRFGHVFLIRATGRSAGEMLSELHRRLHNSVEDERLAVRAELADITVLRIRKLLGLI
ncbi:2-oxo-4-hydroxy-4-carboxy-5-ureidoimidazoline decarboxylase [Nocardia huaxiensis]|uniref:2-oxo-4-hydroxy-4-carboxy-5-ureidoimidazoline decarboxylase n=1 Tax=Nocardia huaxiensis TaxID=2755382 RepID=A0A7D6V6S0_9NOCA|nr:2-oxo-4-hydroxy-4-carboxy-5-ureidoimidazoline decarboxylase [Nocardia huaxiensis]QLY28921.1 2-oxo-4-hydroxy-4-carboxy-5-ureidoimidazoline decarboxylase [Nocardia huaxiensis]UFS97604.1 2-oxo-4-hydroxy-4-carboxy-5-ureidoimidazoline decarboxylase [Nocardia huaxiensis]